MTVPFEAVRRTAQQGMTFADNHFATVVRQQRSTAQAPNATANNDSIYFL